MNKQETKAIQKFVNRIRNAKLNWDHSGGSYDLWIAYYEDKADALDEFRQTFPEIDAVEHLFTWLFSTHHDTWAARLTQRIESIRKGIPCLDCGELVKFPAERCNVCAVEHKKYLVEKREIKKRRKARRK